MKIYKSAFNLCPKSEGHVSGSGTTRMSLIRVFVLALVIATTGTVFGGGSAQALVVFWASDINFSDTEVGAEQIDTATLTVAHGRDDTFSVKILSPFSSPEFTLVPFNSFTFVGGGGHLVEIFTFEITFAPLSAGPKIAFLSVDVSLFIQGTSTFVAKATSTLSVSGSGTPAPGIPAPAALPLFLTGLAGISLIRRRRQA